MKYFVMLFFLTLSLFFASPALASSINSSAAVMNTLNNGLVGWWTFDGADCGSAYCVDKSGNGKTSANTSVTKVTGKIGQGGSFNGSSSVANPGSVSATVQTIAFWIKTTSSTTKIIDLNGTASIELKANVITANNFTGASIYVNGAGVSTITAGKWNHVLIKTATSINASAVTIGQIGSLYYLGSIDDVRFWNRSLSYKEIQQLYQIGNSAVNKSIIQTNTLNVGLKGWWTFDGPDVNATQALDKSGNSRTAARTSVTPVKGKIGQAFSFNGNTQYLNYTAVNIGTAFITQPTGTIAVWLKPTGTPPTITATYNGFAAITDSNGSHTSGGNLGITRGNWVAAGGDRIWVANWDGTDDKVGIPYTNNQWIHVVWVHSLGKLYAYANGALIGSTSSGNTVTVTTFLNIGRNYNNDALDWNGLIDDVRIWNRALSAKEIQQVYMEGGGVINKTLGTFGTPLTTSSSPPNMLNLNKSLAGWWTFDGADTFANSVADKSGNGKTGTRTAITLVAGKIGQGGSFNGSTSLVNPGSVSATVNSVGFWMKTTSSTTKIIDLDGTDYISLTGNVITTNLTSPTIYVNGTNSSTITSGKWNYVLVTTGTSVNASAVKIGQFGANYYLGSLDDVRFWNRALSAKEDTQLYNMGK